VTTHRRENFGTPLASICRAVRTLADTREDCRFIFPVHPNPSVQQTVDAYLRGHARITLVPPMAYPEFVDAMRNATLVLTDSGGVQEEAPALGKPVLVLREETERPEAIAAGVAKLVGCDHDRIVSSVMALLDDPVAWRAMAKGASPYGDGRAAARIVDVLDAFRTSQAYAPA
jgi:UDP-N-acetylglucosamine 2-epimerase (non-hydrolysing)